MALMIKWADYLAGMSGTLTRNKYVRRIPGNTEWALLCERPEYNKSEKKHPHLANSKGQTRVPPILWQYVKREVYRTGKGIEGTL